MLFCCPSLALLGSLALWSWPAPPPWQHSGRRRAACRKRSSSCGCVPSLACLPQRAPRKLQPQQSSSRKSSRPDASSNCWSTCAAAFAAAERRTQPQVRNIRSLTSSHETFVQQKIDDQRRLMELLRTPSPQRRKARRSPTRTPPPVPPEAVSPTEAGSTTPRGSPPKAVHTTVVEVQTSRPIQPTRILPPTSEASIPYPSSAGAHFARVFCFRSHFGNRATDRARARSQTPPRPRSRSRGPRSSR